jgi:hypothetical protein
MSASASGVYIYNATGTGFGFRIRARAGTATRTLKIYTGVFSGTVVLTTHLSDGSHADTTDTLDAGAGATVTTVFTVTYNASVEGQWLDAAVELTVNKGSTPNITFTAATLA